MEEILYTPLVVIHVVACAFLVLVVLLQPGKSGGLGALSGAGAQQVFGGRGAGNILTRITWVTAATFFISSVTLAFLSSSGDDSMRERSVEIGPIDEEPIKVPAAPDAEEPEVPQPQPAQPEDATDEDATDEDATDDESTGEPTGEADEKTRSEQTGLNDEPASPRTPAAPLKPAPAAPQPAPPQPAAPPPATPSPAPEPAPTLPY